MSYWVHERNFRYRKFLFGFGFVYIIVMRPSRHTLRRTRWLVGKTSPYRLYVEYRQFRRFSSGSSQFRNLRYLSGQQSPLPTHLCGLPQRSRRSVVCFSSFHFPWLEFSGDIFAIFVRIQNMFSPLNSAKSICRTGWTRDTTI